ncbi:MAG: type I methionyl aminopeptidase [bacterium]
MNAYSKSKAQLIGMREAGKIHAEILQELIAKTRAGVSTEELNALAEKLMKKNRVEASFKGYKGYPKSICTSINEEIVHGIPSKKKIIKPGDLVKLDMGVYHKGVHADAGATVMVGNVTEEARKLVTITRECLDKAIAAIKPGLPVNVIGRAVEQHAESNGFSVVHDLTGHGVGRQLHEAPEVPNFYRATDKTILEKGMTLAIEPMINVGTREILDLDDGWTIITEDRQLSAYWEHTVAVTDDGYEILTK